MREKLVHVYEDDAKALKKLAGDQDVASAIHRLLIAQQENQSKTDLLARFDALEERLDKQPADLSNKLSENSETIAGKLDEGLDQLGKLSEETKALKQMASETLLFASKTNDNAAKTAVRVKAMSMESSASAELLSELAEVAGVGDVMIGTDSPIWKSAVAIVRQHIELAKSKKQAENNDGKEERK